MATHSLITVFLAVAAELTVVQQAEAGIFEDVTTDILEIFAFFYELVEEIITYIIDETTSPPVNKNSSVQYLLFTPESPNDTCYIEPNLKALERCPFKATYPMKFLIHGFRSTLDNTSLYWQIKDQMLELYEYNVIVVNWTNYDQLPYFRAAMNTGIVGSDIAEFIQFLLNTTGMEAKGIHLVGHSLGAHVAGAAGRQIPDLERITALDPAGPLFYPDETFPPLTYEDANFVDVIHTSNLTTGYGTPYPIGDIDFYPNGGFSQPQCQTIGANNTGPPSFYTGSCNHKASLIYFLESINTTECTFLATLCNNYTDFLEGLCSDNSMPMAEMGLPAKPIVGLDPKSKFYLQTNVSEPYCSKDGYEPS